MAGLSLKKIHMCVKIAPSFRGFPGNPAHWVMDACSRSSLWNLQLINSSLMISLEKCVRIRGLLEKKFYSAGAGILCWDRVSDPEREQGALSNETFPLDFCTTPLLTVRYCPPTPFEDLCLYWEVLPRGVCCASSWCGSRTLEAGKWCAWFEEEWRLKEGRGSSVLKDSRRVQKDLMGFLVPGQGAKMQGRENLKSLSDFHVFTFKNPIVSVHHNDFCKNFLKEKGLSFRISRRKDTPKVLSSLELNLQQRWEVWKSVGEAGQEKQVESSTFGVENIAWVQTMTDMSYLVSDFH